MSIKSFVLYPTSNPVKGEFDSSKHVYRVRGSNLQVPNDGAMHFVPSVTSITRMKDKGPALQNWMLTRVTESVKADWRPQVPFDQRYIDAALLKAKTAHETIRDSAGDLGTMVHTWIESYINARIDSHPEPAVPAGTKGLAKAADAFKKAEVAWGIEWLFSEQIVYSLEYHYIGTLDAVGRLPSGTLVLVDIKTSKGIYPEHFLQTAAYAHCVGEEFGETPAERWIIRISKKRGNLTVYNLEDELRKEAAKFNRKPFTMTDDYMAFLGLRQVYRRFRQA